MPEYLITTTRDVVNARRRQDLYANDITLVADSKKREKASACGRKLIYKDWLGDGHDEFKM